MNHDTRGGIATVLTILTLGVLIISTVFGLISTRQKTSLPSEAANRSYCGVTCFPSLPDCRLGTTCMSEAEAYANQGGGGSPTRYLCWNTDPQNPNYCRREVSGPGSTTRQSCDGNCTRNGQCATTDPILGIPLACDLRIGRCRPVRGGQCPTRPPTATIAPTGSAQPTTPIGIPTTIPTAGPAPTDIPSTTKTTYLISISDSQGEACKVQFDMQNNQIVGGSEQIRTTTLRDYASCYPRLIKYASVPTRIELPYSFDINNRSRQNLQTSLSIFALTCPEDQPGTCNEKLNAEEQSPQLVSNQSLNCIWNNPTSSTSRPTCTVTGVVNPPTATPFPTQTPLPTEIEPQRTKIDTSFPTRLPTPATFSTPFIFATTVPTLFRLPTQRPTPPFTTNTIQTRLNVINNSGAQVSSIKVNVCQQGKCTSETREMSLIPGQSRSLSENIPLPTSSQDTVVISCSLLLADNSERPCGVNKTTTINEPIKVDVALNEGGNIQATAKTRTERADVDNNGVINATDYALCIINYYYRGENLRCDLNDSGRVDAPDISVVTQNFNRQLF